GWRPGTGSALGSPPRRPAPATRSHQPGPLGRGSPSAAHVPPGPGGRGHSRPRPRLPPRVASGQRSTSNRWGPTTLDRYRTPPYAPSRLLAMTFYRTTITAGRGGVVTGAAAHGW